MLLTELQAAREAQVDRRTIRRLIRDGRLRALDFGSGRRHHYRIDPADLRGLASQPNLSPATTPPPPRQRHHRRAASSQAAAAFLPSV